MTVAREEVAVAGAIPYVDPFDPVALEARLAAARLRRSAALAARSEADQDARPPAPATVAAAPPRPIAGGRPTRTQITWAAGFAAGLLVAAIAGLMMRHPATQVATAAPASAPAVVAAAAPIPVPAPVPPAAVVAPADPSPRDSTLRPMPRPEENVAARTAKPVRSTRNAPRALTPPEAVGLVIRDLNRATVGRTAAALGVRERVALPGVPLTVTLDRRGLRVQERPAPKRKARR